MDDRTTTEEQYIRASTSSHLRLCTDGYGDIDLLIAAGLVRDGLATTLFRVKAEFDGQRSADRAAAAYINGLKARVPQLIAQAVAEEARMKFGPTRAAKYHAQAKAMAEQIEHETLSSRAFILANLRTLAAAKQALGAYALQQAPRRHMPVDHTQDRQRVLRVSGRVLESLLDSLCPACEGRGFWGGHGTPLVWHQGKGSCERTGRRKIHFGASIEEQAFAQWMLSDLERKVARVDKMMREFLGKVQDWHAVALDPSLVNSSHADLLKRLTELRSPATAAD